MERTSEQSKNIQAEIASLIKQGIEAEHDFIQHKTNAVAKFEGSATPNSTSGATSKYLRYSVAFDGPNSKYSGTYMIARENENLKGLLVNKELSIKTELGSDAILRPQLWAGPAVMLQAVSDSMKGQDLDNFHGQPELLKQAYDDQFKLDFEEVAKQATSYEAGGTYGQKLNHQLAYYLEGLDRQYQEFDGSVPNTFRNAVLDVKAGDLMARAARDGIAIEPRNVFQLAKTNDSFLRLSNTSGRFNDIMNMPNVKAVSDVGVKASDFSAINYFSPRPVKAGIQDHLLHLSRLAASPIMAPDKSSSKAHIQTFDLHQKKLAECWGEVKSELENINFSNRSDIKSISNKLNGLPDAPWMKDMEVEGVSFKDIIDAAKVEMKSKYKELYSRDMEEAYESPTPSP